MTHIFSHLLVHMCDCVACVRLQILLTMCPIKNNILINIQAYKGAELANPSNGFGHCIRQVFGTARSTQYMKVVSIFGTTQGLSHCELLNWF